MLLKATISAFVFLALTQLWLNKLASANPYGSYSEDIEVAPLVYPSITIVSPAENITLRDSNNLTIVFKATIDSGNFKVRTETGTYITVDLSAHVGELFYKPSWQSNKIKVSSWDYSDPWNPIYFINLTGVPDGTQTVTITAYGHGDYPGTVPIPQEYPWDPDTETVCYYFDSVSNYTLGFTVDTFSPSPEPTPNPHEIPVPTEQEVILGLVLMVVTIGGSLGLLLYGIKRK